jgi:hypothetical protein
MCYEALRDGDATERPLGEILRAELSDAAVNGLAAALIVAVVLTGRGIDPLTTVAFALAACALGAVVHQTVLVAGVSLLRVRSPNADADDATTA